jgi:hypothetical protein
MNGKCSSTKIMKAPVQAGEFWTSGQRRAHSLHEISHIAQIETAKHSHFSESKKPLRLAFEV